jgi:hypothetical protein
MSAGSLAHVCVRSLSFTPITAGFQWIGAEGSFFITSLRLPAKITIAPGLSYITIHSVRMKIAL